jgi:hypothetical protein
MEVAMERFGFERYPANLLMQDAIIILMPVVLILLGFLLFG